MAFNIRISQILSLIIFVLSIGIIVQNIIREKQTSKKTNNVEKITRKTG